MSAKANANTGDKTNAKVGANKKVATAEAAPAAKEAIVVPMVQVPADERVANATPPTILFISGSPRRRTSTDLISLIEQGARKAGANVQEFFLCDRHIDPCTGCGSCEKTGACVLANRTRDGRFADDYLELIAMLENCDAVALAVPLYFAGPPAQFKALLDRMQPYWARKYILNEAMGPKRPAQLFVCGGGNDPHGYDPLATSTKSAIQVAGFTLEKLNLYIGFRAFADAAILPPEHQREGLSKGDINKLKNAVIAQEDFVQRAIHAGSAFARYLIKMREKSVLTAELAAVEAELAALKSGEGVVELAFEPKIEQTTPPPRPQQKNDPDKALDTDLDHALGETPDDTPDDTPDPPKAA